MALRVLSDRKYSGRKKPQISLNPLLKRISFNRAARNLMVEYFKEEFEDILILIDDERTDAFWLKPAREDEPDARHLNKTVGGTRTCSCTILLQALKYQEKETKNFPLSYDKANDAFMVNLSEGAKGG